MPAPASQNKYSELVNNHVIFRNKMAIAFVQAFRSLNELSSPGPLTSDFTKVIDGYSFRYSPGSDIYINEVPFSALDFAQKTEAYNRLDKFMTICLSQLDHDYNL